jgi:hypothetical protein
MQDRKREEREVQVTDPRPSNSERCPTAPPPVLPSLESNGGGGGMAGSCSGEARHAIGRFADGCEMGCIAPGMRGFSICCDYAACRMRVFRSSRGGKGT